MPYGYALGTIEQDLYDRFLQEQAIVERVAQYVLRHKQSAAYLALQQLIFDDAVVAGAREALALIFPGERISGRALLQIYAAVRYDGYIQREEAEVAKVKQYAHLAIPVGFSFKGIQGLSFELQLKLERHRPATVAQAQLIPGMTPAAVSLLIYHIRKVV